MKIQFQYQRSGHTPTHLGQPSPRTARGFTLLEIMIVVAVIGMLAAIALPNVAAARKTAQTQNCVVNLHQLDESKQEWAIEHRKGLSAIPDQEQIVPYLRANQMPVCPAGGEYRLRRVERAPVCELYATGHTLNSLNPEDDELPD